MLLPDEWKLGSLPSDQRVCDMVSIYLILQHIRKFSQNSLFLAEMKWGSGSKYGTKNDRVLVHPHKEGATRDGNKGQREVAIEQQWTR